MPKAKLYRKKVVLEQNHRIDIIKQNIEQEPFARLFNIKVMELAEGHSKVTMKIKKEYDNIFNITHGGAIFSLLDVAFGSAANSYGTDLCRDQY